MQKLLQRIIVDAQTQGAIQAATRHANELKKEYSNYHELYGHTLCRKCSETLTLPTLRQRQISTQGMPRRANGLNNERSDNLAIYSTSHEDGFGDIQNKDRIQQHYV